MIIYKILSKDWRKFGETAGQSFLVVYDISCFCRTSNFREIEINETVINICQIVFVFLPPF